ncbi:hypothetical protein JOF56_010983 [Kibdelosporangium banguiense]|uniref:Uncharacterized protein n=1 Tax=Kibdelosporangium banguiense TaxID=1365924 RepID=A0ABS4U1R2_9PSEU|nr:hypothetical protein [Kibdelosporangium banguiense]MBP2330598.1 hypothetical protein [Kibdelosporangium banguiense]
MIHEPGGKRTKIRNGKSKVVSTGKRPNRRPAPPSESCTQSTPEYCHTPGSQDLGPHMTIALWFATVTGNPGLDGACVPYSGLAECVVPMNLRSGDRLTEQLKQWKAFTGIAEEVGRLVAKGQTFGSNDYHYSKMGIAKAGWNLVKDLANVAGAVPQMLIGNDPISLLTGSFDLDWQVVGYENDRLDPVLSLQIACLKPGRSGVDAMPTPDRNGLRKPRTWRAAPSCRACRVP